MFIATVSYGLAVSVPRGEDAERAVNSTGPGEKGSVLLPGSTWGPGNGRGDTPGLLPVLSHTLVGHSPRSVPHEGRSGGGSGPSLLRSR